MALGAGCGHGAMIPLRQIFAFSFLPCTGDMPVQGLLASAREEAQASLLPGGQLATRGFNIILRL